MGNISLHVEKSVLECLREFGLAMFLIGAGVEAGAGFIEILKEQGLIPVSYTHLSVWKADGPVWSGYLRQRV